MDGKLLKLKRKKLRQKVLYLRTELNETKLIFQNSLFTFNKDFGEYFNKEKRDLKGKQVIFDNPIFNIPRKNVNLIFRWIAQKIHPDKLIHKDISKEEFDDYVELYKEANESVENKDWARVIEIASDLGIDISGVKKDDIEYLEESVKGLEDKIKELKGTYAWLWEHTVNESKEKVRKQILQSLGLNKEKENGNTR